jgi:CBS domain-containing protein
MKTPIGRAVEVVGDRQSIRDLLAQRPVDRHRLYSLPADASVVEATKLMLEEDITAVVSGSSGLVTNTDILKKVVLAGRDPKKTALSEVATPLDRCAYIFPENDVESALTIMAAAQVHHLPVLDDMHSSGGRILAVVSLPELAGLNRSLREKRAAYASEQGWNGISPLSVLSTLLSSRSSTPSSSSSSGDQSAISTSEEIDGEGRRTRRVVMTAPPVASWEVAKSITDTARKQAEDELENGVPVAPLSPASELPRKRSGAASSLPA